MMVKHTTAIELTLLARQTRQLRGEIEWLVTDEAVEEAEKLLPVWLLQLDARLFREAVEVLRRPAPAWRRGRGRVPRPPPPPAYARRPVLRARAVGRRSSPASSRTLDGSSKKLTPRRRGRGHRVRRLGGDRQVDDHRPDAPLARREPPRCAGSTPASRRPRAHVRPPASCCRLRRVPSSSARPGRTPHPGPRAGAGPDVPADVRHPLRDARLRAARALLTHAFAPRRTARRPQRPLPVVAERGAGRSAARPLWAAPDPPRKRLTALETCLYDDVPAPDLVVHRRRR